jgi:hypothetical protein
MDADELDSDQDLLEEDAAAPDADAAEEDDSNDAPSDEEAPDDGDEDDDADDSDEEDPQAELERLREERRERDRADRERAERETAETARRQQVEAQQAEQQKTYRRNQAWQTYRGKKAALSKQRDEDYEAASQSGDPRRLWAELKAQRDREDLAIDAEYQTWKDQDAAAEQWALRQALERSSLREYADHVRDAYGLPHNTLQEIMTYGDGTPVGANAFAARAAEILDRRTEADKAKRKQRRLSREEGKDAARGKTRAVPGGGRGTPPKELEGTLDELAEYFPMGRDIVRQSRARPRR